MHVAVVGVSAAAAACLAEEPLGDEGRGTTRQGEESLDGEEHTSSAARLAWVDEHSRRGVGYPVVGVVPPSRWCGRVR